jgi:hypothetical protein
MKLFAQGDLLFERLDNSPDFNSTAAQPEGATLVLAHGEKSGHRHTLHGAVSLLRDEVSADDIPAGLYVGHVNVSGSAFLTHQEHGAIALAERTYRVRRQRVFDPADAAVVED